MPDPLDIVGSCWTWTIPPLLSVLTVVVCLLYFIIATGCCPLLRLLFRDAILAIHDLKDSFKCLVLALARRTYSSLSTALHLLIKAWDFIIMQHQQYSVTW